MTESVIVNFHCHSIFSDGDQTPEALAANLAKAGVKFASLTDHDTTEGTGKFREAAKKLGILTISGVEITTWLDKKELHLLAYGFDENNRELQDLLLSIRQTQAQEVHSIAGTMRKYGTNSTQNLHSENGKNPHGNGFIETSEAIKIVHQSGGLAFFAHPLHLEPDWEKLRILVEGLKHDGLDGIEVYYQPFSIDQRSFLLDLAKSQGLFFSAGTDLHNNDEEYAIEIPTEDWKLFRDAVINNLEPNSQSDYEAKKNSKELHLSKAHHHVFNIRSFVFRIFLPTITAMGLFLAALWAIFLPSFENTLMDRKRELIRELTQSAWSILVSYEKKESSGLLSREEAQTQAISQISALRYGPEGKDYFWLQDLQPRMLMHPYRPDLNGQDVSSFTDANGTQIFVKFADIVRADGEGYVDYVWQWKDDPSRLEPKQSYVKGFTPWGWLIGTGIYIDDVNTEIGRLERSIVIVSVVISAAVILLLLIVLQQSLRIEKARQEVVDSLNESIERYHQLSEATTEGTVLVMNDRCRFANNTFLKMTGYSDKQLEFMELVDILPKDPENIQFWERFTSLLSENPDNSTDFLTGGVDGSLLCKDGSKLDSVLLINPVVFLNQKGFILIAKQLNRENQTDGKTLLPLIANYAPIGLFQARNNRRGTIEQMNGIARQYFPIDDQHLDKLFPAPEEFVKLRKDLDAGLDLKDVRVVTQPSTGTPKVLSLSLKLIHQEENDNPNLVGLIRDITTESSEIQEKDNLIAKMQASLLFLHEPLSQISRNLVLCDLNESVSEVAKKMAKRQVTACLITSKGDVIGIVTEHDLGIRTVAKSLDLKNPVREVMTSPVERILETEPVYSALIQMEEKKLSHLAVCDQEGLYVNLVDARSLLQFEVYGFSVLEHELKRALTGKEISEIAKRIPLLTSTLGSASLRLRHITNMLSSIADSATERLIELAIDSIGAPPAEFSFISMGSNGRKEPTLVTDQDNGIIYRLKPGDDKEQIQGYFERLGKIVCDGLNDAGYTYCNGGVMAKNPDWCHSLTDWVEVTRKWITNPEPQQLLDMSIFFDFRAVSGNKEIENDFHKSIDLMLEGEPAVFIHLAQSALEFKPRFPGSSFLGAAEMIHPGEINLKDALIPVVGFARLYALRNKIHQTNTVERLEALAALGIINHSSFQETVESFDLLMQLRLQQQILNIKQGLTPTNIIQIERLSYMQKEQVKQALVQISVLQKKISYDFLGGG